MELFLSKLMPLLAIAIILFIAWLLGKGSKLNLKFIFFLLLAELLLAAALLYIPFLTAFLDLIAKLILKILDFTREGSLFVFGDWVDVSKTGYIFAIQVLPALIVFSALTSILFYYGIIQWFVRLLAKGLQKIIKLSGAECTAFTSNIILGQMEVVLLLKEYVPKMSKREIAILMASGMASLSAVLLAVYSKMLGGCMPDNTILISRHFLTASVLSAPSMIIISEIIFRRYSNNNENEILTTEPTKAKNILDAILKGTMTGLKMAAQAAAMLIVFIALIALLNYLLGLLGRIGDLNSIVSNSSEGKFSQLSFQYLLGLIFAPIVYLIGLAPADMIIAGGLLGEKTIINEFVAYVHLSQWWTMLSSPKSGILIIYMLFGFANFTSVGILVAGISTIAPNKAKEATEVGFIAMIGGALASLLSAAIVSILLL